MSQKDKLIKKIKYAKTANFDDIHLLLTQLEFDFRCRGSHYTYVKDSYVIGIVKH